jgi:hypothetical protein
MVKMKPLRELTAAELSALTDDELVDGFVADIDAFHQGSRNRRAEHLQLARSEEMAGVINALWDEAEVKRPPPRPEPKTEPKLRPPEQIPAASNASGGLISKGVMDGLTAKYKTYAAAKGKKPAVKFHESDLTPDKATPPTIEERDKALERLADLYDTDPLTYARERVEWAERLCTNREALDKAVRIVRDKRTDETEQSQATKLVAIGVSEGVRLWHSPEGLGYASVCVSKHWENFRIESTAFDKWLRAEYGRQNTCKIGDKFLPKAPGAAAVRDAISTLEGVAQHRGLCAEPAIRIGGDREVIWIDLGTDDWSAIRVSADGWKVEDRADVAFIRNSALLPLPEPVKGGSFQSLRRVLNVRASELVLVAGWLLQTWCPLGPYAHFNVSGESGEGKSQLCRAMRRTIDPSRYDLRKASKVEDLLIAARNNWVLCFDNMSWISKDWSDTLCMIATGASFGTRRHYTNDEEAAFAAKRAVIFNGIPSELTERSDLASRVVRLEVPPITERKTEAELEEVFLEIWPGVLGVLLDGLVGAIRDWHSIRVAEPARMMDFERWAEAGCRAMGFAEWEFVDAYAINRRDAMALAARTSPVGRAVMAFLKKNPKGFKGTTAVFLSKLEVWRNGARWPDWPKDPTRLSSELRRLRKPLRAVGIACDLDVDLRPEEEPHRGIEIRSLRQEKP